MHSRRFWTIIFLLTVIISLHLSGLYAQDDGGTHIHITSAQQDAYGSIQVRFTVLNSLGTSEIQSISSANLQLRELNTSVDARLSSLIELHPEDLTPIDLVLVVDLTSTMANEIGSVHGALQDLLTNLAQMGIRDIRVGIVTFDSSVQTTDLQQLSSLSLPQFQVSNNTTANSNVLLNALNSGANLFTAPDRRHVLFVITDATGTAQGQSLLQREQFTNVQTFIVPVASATAATYQDMQTAIGAVVFPEIIIDPNALQTINPFMFATSQVRAFVSREYQVVGTLFGHNLQGQIALQLGILRDSSSTVSNVVRLNYTEPQLSVQLTAPTSSPSGDVTGGEIPLAAEISTTGGSDNYQYRFVIGNSQQEIEICSRSTATMCNWQPSALGFPYGTYPFFVQVYDFTGTQVTIGGPLILNYYDPSLQIDIPSILRGPEIIQVRFTNASADTASLYWLDNDQVRLIAEATRDSSNTALLSFVTSDAFFLGQSTDASDMTVHLRIDTTNSDMRQLVSRWESSSVVVSAADYSLDISDQPPVSVCQPSVPFTLHFDFAPSEPIRSGLTYIGHQRFLGNTGGGLNSGAVSPIRTQDSALTIDPATYPISGLWEVSVAAVDVHENYGRDLELTSPAQRQINIIKPIVVTGDIQQDPLWDSSNITIPVSDAALYGVSFLPDETNEIISVVLPSIVPSTQNGVLSTSVSWSPVFDHLPGHRTIQGQVCIFLKDAQGNLTYNWVEHRSLQLPDGIPLIPNAFIWVVLGVTSIAFTRFAKVRQLRSVVSRQGVSVFPVVRRDTKTRFPKGNYIDIDWKGEHTSLRNIEVRDISELSIGKRTFLSEPNIAFSSHEDMSRTLGIIAIHSRQSVEMELIPRNPKDNPTLDVYVRVAQGDRTSEYIKWADTNNAYGIKRNDHTLTLTQAGTYRIVCSLGSRPRDDSSSKVIWSIAITIR